MSNADLLRLAFAAGIVYALFRQMRKDVNGIGMAMRSDRAKAERRWKHDIANDIEELRPREQAARLAKRLREDAWRD